MNTDTIRKRVGENMRRHGLAIDDLRVQPDPYSGWWLWLVSDAFQGMPPKGTGKMAIFRRLVEKPDQPTVVVLAPAPLRGQRLWVLGADGFKQVEERLRQQNADWREGSD